jgi:hypothetical protein
VLIRIWHLKSLPVAGYPSGQLSSFKSYPADPAPSCYLVSGYFVVTDQLLCWLLYTHPKINREWASRSGPDLPNLLHWLSTKVPFRVSLLFKIFYLKLPVFIILYCLCYRYIFRRSPFFPSKLLSLYLLYIIFYRTRIFSKFWNRYRSRAQCRYLFSVHKKSSVPCKRLSSCTGIHRLLFSRVYRGPVFFVLCCFLW